MEHYLLFAAYLVLFAWLVTKVKFFTRTGFSNPQLVILFLLKVMAGIFYGWLGVYYGKFAKMLDTWTYHIESLREYKLLLSHPVKFFTSIFTTTYEGGYTNFLTTHNSWWNDVKANFLIKIMAIFNVFSFGNYYINAIFYAFISLFGAVAIYRIMIDLFPFKRTAVAIACFLVPSFLFWTSGLHKEGLIFLGLSLIIYQVYRGLKEGRFAWYRFILIFLGLCLVAIFRNFVLFPLAPPLLAWILSQKFKWKPTWVFSTVFVLSLTFFFTAKYISPSLDFPKFTVIKQEEFAKTEGNTSIHVRKLEPDFKSFVLNAPQAFSMAILRPYPSDVIHLLSLAAALEITGILLFFLIFFVWRSNKDPLPSFALFCFFFSFGIIMMIGYSVNNLGAIVRYRSIIFPLLLAPMAAQIDWVRFAGSFAGNIKNNNN